MCMSIYMYLYIYFQMHAQMYQNCGPEPRQSTSATMPTLHPPVEVQSGVTHGE